MKCIIVKFHLVGRSLFNVPTGTKVASGHSDLPRWNRTLMSTTANICVNPAISFFFKMAAVKKVDIGTITGLCYKWIPEPITINSTTVIRIEVNISHRNESISITVAGLLIVLLHFFRSDKTSRFNIDSQVVLCWTSKRVFGVDWYGFDNNLYLVEIIWTRIEWMNDWSFWTLYQLKCFLYFLLYDRKEYNEHVRRVFWQWCKP